MEQKQKEKHYKIISIENHFTANESEKEFQEFLEKEFDNGWEYIDIIPWKGNWTRLIFKKK